MIFEAIAAIKVANDAIAAIREMAGNVQSVGQLGSHLTKLTDAEDEIKKKAADGDMDAFFALEKITQEKKAIREMMQWNGRAGLWEDFQRFQATRRELREKEKKRIAAKKARQKRLFKEWCVGLGLGALLLTGIGVIVFIFYWIANNGN